MPIVPILAMFMQIFVNIMQELGHSMAILVHVMQYCTCHVNLSTYRANNAYVGTRYAKLGTYNAIIAHVMPIRPDTMP